MSLTIVKGMQSEIFVPITPPMVWTPVTKELKDMKIALATAAGVHHKEQKRFNLAGAIAGMATGAAFVIFWDYIKIGGETLGSSTGIYSLVVAILLIFVAPSIFVDILKEAL